MIFHNTTLSGARLIECERRQDERGFFGRVFCEAEHRAEGLATRFVQVNDSFSVERGTLRGFHYQLTPSAEVKIVRCIQGRLYDVIVDLRPDSPSFGRWFGQELSAENRLMMYVPQGCAHAFLTLEDDTEALYLVSAPHDPQMERGFRYDDPWMSVTWPMRPERVSGKDLGWPLFDPAFHGIERLRGLVAADAGT